MYAWRLIHECCFAHPTVNIHIVPQEWSICVTQGVFPCACCEMLTPPSTPRPLQGRYPKYTQLRIDKAGVRGLQVI